jgi:alpha-glucosidase
LPLYTTDRPEIHAVIREMRAVTNEFHERLLIGEIYLPIERLMSYYGRELDGLHLPFNFALLSTPWRARAVAKLVDEYEALLPAGGWPNWVLGNHDRPRIASRTGPDQAKVAAMLLLTLRGTPTIYYGDEIGMEQVAIAKEDVRDPFERNVPGIGVGRDGCRTPMQWDGTNNAGFSTARPWLPLDSSYRTRNVIELRGEKASIYNLCRKLIALRRERRPLNSGAYRPVAAKGNLLLFTRTHEREQMLIALNFGAEPAQVSFSAGPLKGRLVLSSFADREGEAFDSHIDLRGHEGAVFELSSAGDASQMSGRV